MRDYIHKTCEKGDIMMNSIEQLARYSYNFGGEAIGAAIAIIVIVIFIGIAAILSHVFLGLVVYHDAKAKGNSNSGMWGVLSGIFGWIPAIIYLCLRNSAAQKIIQCVTCGFAIPANAPGCPNCNHANPFAQQFYGPFVEQTKKKAKGFLIAFICCYAAVILLAIAIAVIIVVFAGNYYYYY